MPRPSLIACRTIIGYGAPNKTGTAATHGSPLGATSAAARAALGWEHPPFEVPEHIGAAWRAVAERGTLSAASLGEAPAGGGARHAQGVCGGNEPRDPGRGGASRPRSASGLCAEQAEHRDARLLAKSAGAARRGVAQPGRRLGRPDRLERHAGQGATARHGGRFFRQLHPLRRARARHGGGHERHRAAWRPRPLWRHVPRLRRLFAAGDPARRADGHPRRPRDDARFDRARRGRADPPAGGASLGAPRHPQPPGVPPGGCGGDGRGVAVRAEARAHAFRAVPVAAEPADAPGRHRPRQHGGAWRLSDPRAGDQAPRHA